MIILIAVVLEASKSNPKDLEKGMTRYQRAMYKKLIEDWKRYNGMGPKENAPWYILVELAEEVREMYNK